ncbi:helix-turn-helix domain-containing protein [Natronomonas sp. EA1]|uniref:helix-turn-helix domain-containing protein n=1 Tax=Natronomonas sp. EA1 TaxID=3421655 RepID=UPI003EBB619C
MISECLVVEFRVTGDDCPLAEASRATGAAIDALPPLLRGDGYTLHQVSTQDSDVGAVLDADERIRYLHGSQSDGRYTYRFLSKGRCVVHDLIDEGFLVESMRVAGGTEHHVGAVVGHDVLEGVLQAAGDAVGVGIQRISPLGDDAESTVASRWDLTPAQEAAVRAAFEAGYFDVPKRCTASEVAAELGISKSAFLERLRRAQSSLFGQILV